MGTYPDSPVLKPRIYAALEWLFDYKSGVNVTKIEWQAEHPLIAVDVSTGEESVLTTYPAGPWVCVDFSDGEQYAIWKQTGDVYMMDEYGAVEEEPMPRQRPQLYDQEADNDELGTIAGGAGDGADRELRGGEG